jgi:hypothetical protein
MQIKWWHYRTGIGALEESENGVEESEYRRDERLVALSEVSFFLRFFVYVGAEF